MWFKKARSRELFCSFLNVNGIACASTAGVVLATMAMLVANRVLPMTLGSRAEIEAGIYFAVSLAAFVHAAWRARGTATNAAWREQGWAIAVLALSAAVLNGVTTGDFPWVALARGDWAVAGVDAVLLASVVVAALAAYRLGARVGTAPAAPGTDAVQRKVEVV